MVIIERYSGTAVTEHRVEIVERKGTGHPDYICDAVMESISVALSKYYLREFGTVLHHNIDKGLLVAGVTEKRFGGGRVIKPMELFIGDRATFKVAEKEIPVREIATETAREWFRSNLRHIDPKEHIKFNIVLAEGSEELKDIFQRPGETRGSNDTSAAVGYYPLTPTEKAVYSLERYLNSEEFKKRHPETGEDIKIMGLRTGRVLDITVAMPLLAKYINSEKEYFQRKEEIHADMMRFSENFTEFDRVSISFNTLDEKGRGLGGIYLSLLGTSAEDADSGQVGRGNRVNGLISINRPLGTEAAAGKNPVSHIGKIYNILSHKIAKEIYEGVEGIREVYVLLLNRIGMPIDRPLMANAQVVLEGGVALEDVKAPIKSVVESELENINAFCKELIEGKYPVC